MVNELRLNNWISVQFDQRKEIQITVTNIEQLVNHGPEMLMKGITINEEWLIKMGFVKVYTETYEIKPNINDCYCICFHLDYNSVTISDGYGNDYLVKNIKYVHQLQNLFQSLTQTELIIVNK